MDWERIILTFIASTPITGGLIAGVGWWFKTRREDRKILEALHQNVVQKLLDRNEKLQMKMESLLADTAIRERDFNVQLTDRIAMDKQSNGVIIAATAALERAATALARSERGP